MMASFCGIEIVGDAIDIDSQRIVNKYQDYPTLEESTVGEDESLEQYDQPQNDDGNNTEVQESSPEGSDGEVEVEEEEEESENTFSRLVVCYQQPSDKPDDTYYMASERGNVCGSSALCSSGNTTAAGGYSYSYYHPDSRISSRSTRDILERSGSKLNKLYPKNAATAATTNAATAGGEENSPHNFCDYPEDAPNLLEDCDFEILAPQDTMDEGQAEEVQVLNPDIMEDLQSHLPLTKKGESFWLQYSLIRDGASMDSLLYKIRNTDHCVLAIETVDGDVFGAYTTHRWRYHDDFFGHRDAFLWRKNPDPNEDGIEDVQCYHFSHLNQDVQLCTHDRLAVGGGIRKFDPEYGFGISLDKDLLTGTTSKSMTFLNPPLSPKHADGSTFEVRNIEVWALTPCLSLEDAERVAERVQNKPIWA